MKQGECRIISPVFRNINRNRTDRISIAMNTQSIFLNLAVGGAFFAAILCSVRGEEGLEQCAKPRAMKAARKKSDHRLLKQRPL